LPPAVFRPSVARPADTATPFIYQISGPPASPFARAPPRPQRQGRLSQPTAGRQTDAPQPSRPQRNPSPLRPSGPPPVDADQRRQPDRRPDPPRCHGVPSLRSHRAPPPACAGLNEKKERDMSSPCPIAAPNRQPLTESSPRSKACSAFAGPVNATKPTSNAPMLTCLMPYPPAFMADYPATSLPIGSESREPSSKAERSPAPSQPYCLPGIRRSPFGPSAPKLTHSSRYPAPQGYTTTKLSGTQLRQLPLLEVLARTSPRAAGLSVVQVRVQRARHVFVARLRNLG